MEKKSNSKTLKIPKSIIYRKGLNTDHANSARVFKRHTLIIKFNALNVWNIGHTCFCLCHHRIMQARTHTNTHTGTNTPSVQM